MSTVAQELDCDSPNNASFIFRGKKGRFCSEKKAARLSSNACCVVGDSQTLDEGENNRNQPESDHDSDDESDDEVVQFERANEGMYVVVIDRQAKKRQLRLRPELSRYW